jgi:hypothetical protein
MTRLRPAARASAAVVPHLLLMVLVALTGCAGAQAVPAGAASAGPWTDLLQAPTTQWRGYQKAALPDGWRYDASTRQLIRTAGGGDIVTRAQYGDFELELEWKVGPKGNSGVFYRATEATPRIYENSPEMQILDNAGHNDGKNTLTSSGSNYALDAPMRDVTRPIGQWNQARVVAVGDRVEHWLNGVKVVEYTTGSADWVAKVKASKFNQWPTYGLARRGHIGLQDHGDVVSFRNIRVRELTR